MLPNSTISTHNLSVQDLRLYPFHLDLRAETFAVFPFIMDGAALDLPGERGISCGISSRAAGPMGRVPEMAVNRNRLYASLGVDPAQVYTCTQVHSQEVLLIEAESPPEGARADGMITRDPGRCLLVTVADCLPVYLYDTESGGFGLVHSGWKGTGIALTALRLMESHWHTRPEAVAAVLGPCIGPCSYRVDAERARGFDAEFGGAAGAYPLGPVVKDYALPGSEAQGFALDLQAANVRLLVNAGVRHIALCENCTITDERLGSFRREGPAYTPMAALVG
ncbi:MAG: polyphenol oxidase family protein, partial [Treponema sp.]|nr:polyphenol oxidase family protein [Treponema sp.]